MVACLDVNEPWNGEHLKAFTIITVCCEFTHMRWLTHQHRTRWHSTKTSWQMMPHLSFTKTSVWERQKSSLIFISLCNRTQVSACCNLGTKHLPLRFNKICLSQLLKTHCSRLTTVFHKFPVLGPSCLLSIHSMHTSSCTPVLNYGWPSDIWDDTFVTSIHLYKVRLSIVVPLCGT